MSDSLFDEPELGREEGDDEHRLELERDAELQRRANEDVDALELGGGVEATLERAPAGAGHVLLHVRVDDVDEARLRELADELKAAALERGAVYAYATVQPARPPR